MMASRYDKVRVPRDHSSIATAGTARSTLGPSAMPHEEDFSLIRRVAAKDRQAFERLYQQYYPRLMGYVGKLLGRHELAEDVVHEVMMVVWNEAARFRYTSRLSTWLFGIAYHKTLKAQAKTAEKPSDRLPVAPTTLDQEDPVDALTRQETHKALVHAVQALSPEQRAVVELTFYHDCSYQEIAAIVGCPVNTVKTRMLYARKRLAQLLSELDMTQNLE